ncbi:MAG TPA: hypothetical protein PKD10_15745 [Paracoccaceae bacterium]|nr:hypothetical protein [Paracoccaceae bacterium]HMO72282.1 hypothetical protein [Paracoccaceae bacterium]
MTDPNLQDFYLRVARIESARQRGLGFEAEGALGRSHYKRPSRRRIAIVKPLLVTVASIILLKATIHYHVGDGVYRERVAVLAAGDDIDRVGAFLMAPDTATLWLSQKMQAYAPR